MQKERGLVGTIVFLVVACLVAGLFLRAIGIDSPFEFFTDLAGTVERIGNFFMSTFGWAIRYIALGAFIVLPVYGVSLLLRRRKAEQKAKEGPFRSRETA